MHSFRVITAKRTDTHEHQNTKAVVKKAIFFISMAESRKSNEVLLLVESGAVFLYDVLLRLIPSARRTTDPSSAIPYLSNFIVTRRRPNPLLETVPRILENSPIDIFILKKDLYLLAVKLNSSSCFLDKSSAHSWYILVENNLRHCLVTTCWYWELNLKCQGEDA